MSHIDLSTKHHCSWLTITTVHEFEKTQILLDRTVTERTVRARTCRRTFLLGNHLCALLVNISAPILNQPDCKIPQLLEVITCIIDICPLKTQPLDISFDALNIFSILFHWIGIVEAQVTSPSISLCNTEVDSNSFGMANVKVSIRLWRETRLNAVAIFTLSQVFLNHLLYKVEAPFLFIRGFFEFCHISMLLI